MQPVIRKSYEWENAKGGGRRGEWGPARTQVLLNKVGNHGYSHEHAKPGGDAIQWVGAESAGKEEE